MSLKEQTFIKFVIRKFKDITLFKKILIAYFLIGFISVLITFVVYQINSRQFVKNEIISISERNSNLVSNSISSRLETADNLSKLILSNSYIQDSLKNKKTFASVQTIQNLKKILTTFMTMQPDVCAIYLFNMNDKYAGCDTYRYFPFSFKKVSKASWYDSTMAKEGYYQFSINAGENYSLNDNTNEITITRCIYDLNTQTDLLGILVLNLEESLFKSSLNTDIDVSDVYITVTDSAGASLISNYKGFDIANLNYIKDETSTYIDKKNKKIYTSSSIPNTDWFVTQSISYAKDVSNIFQGSVLFWFLLIIIILLLISITFVMNRIIAKPIHQLTEAMNSRTRNMFEPLLDDGRKDELGMLRRTYNSMLKRIQEEEKRKRNAELYALQMQVKPHFLYNTIDTARSLVLSDKKEEANKMLLSFGQFYRDSICGNAEVIPLRNEIDMIKNYLIIQKIRYGNLFETVYDIDESLLDFPVLRLILQPLVENALYHGIRDSGHSGVITVSVGKNNSHSICISITDNGSGMESEFVKKLLLKRETFSQKEGIGLYGTIDRLRLFYHSDDIVEIKSTKNFGTSIEIIIPE